MKRKILAIAVVIILTMPSVFAGHFFIDVSVITRDNGKQTSGSGGFQLDKDEYGRVALTFPDDVTDFIIQSAGTRQTPISHSLDKSGEFVMAGRPWLMADIYLRPSLNSDMSVHLNGLLIKMIRDDSCSDLRYSYDVQNLDFDLPSSGEYDYALYPKSNDKQIDLKIVAGVKGEMLYKPLDVQYITIHEDYSLFDINTGQVYMQGACDLGFGGDPRESKGNCDQRLLIPLAGTDTLLYMAISDISNLVKNPDSTVTFDFSVGHLYLINPINYSPDAEQLKSERSTVVFFRKTVTCRPGEKTEIEIPPDKDSPLPYKAKEIIVLTTKVDE